MSSKYKIGDGQYAHFVAFTVVNWIDVFTRDEYRHIIIDSLNHCSKHKGLMVHAYCPDSYRDDQSCAFNN